MGVGERPQQRLSNPLGVESSARQLSYPGGSRPARVPGPDPRSSETVSGRTQSLLNHSAIVWPLTGASGAPLAQVSRALPTCTGGFQVAVFWGQGAERESGPACRGRNQICLALRTGFSERSILEGMIIRAGQARALLPLLMSFRP